jgi:DNA-binding MarR family transcriptional regulator
MTSSSEGPCGTETWGILAHLWQLMQSVLDESAPALEEMGLTPKAFFLLAAVEEHPFPAELARVMHLPPPTVTYLVKQMEAAGFLERRPEPGDLRKFRLVVTDAGRRAIGSGREAIGSVVNARLARLGPEEIGPFDRVVERLARPASE